MLVSKIDEILEVLPTARWKDPLKLLSCIEDEESALMQPILGDELMDYLQQQYLNLIEKYGKLTSRALPLSDLTEDEKPMIRLIRQVQKALILRMMSNNINTLSASFNEGGGLNKMAADSYDSMSGEEIRYVKTELWHNSVKAIDGVLYILERDATSDSPKWKEKWEKSEWYFQHSDLLFPTLRSMLSFYPLPKTEQRVEFMELLPDIRYCQNTYIMPMLGQDLIDLLLTEQNDVVKKSLQLVRVALGLFIRAKIVRTPPHPKSELQHQLADLEASAAQSLQTAMKYMQEHSSELAPAIESSQFYKPPIEEQHRHCCKEEEKEYHCFSKLL